MNQASLYQRANQVQRHDAQQIVAEFAGVFQWRSDGRDTLLDVGSGSGNVLMDFVHPILPKNYVQLVGTDISKKMVGYASSCYQQYERTEFKVLDIGCEELPKELVGVFDHVTSFYCLHWVQNQRRALSNIHRLLRREGGDCLLVFLAANPVYEVYKLLAKTSEWCGYMQDVDDFISPLHYSSDPKSEFSSLLNEAGFVDYSVELRNEAYVYEGVDTLKDNVKAICPFLERIPATQHDAFLADFVSFVVRMDLREQIPSTTPFATGIERFISPYTLLVVYARKSPSFVRNVIINEHQPKGLP